ncbi:hypothetical protein K503DRAFT_311119 [Rhizopogon vinicolor AM-OR11-026]|uniref:Uncharacterized protein n=1 Tax=Rhizopogon vinicolor AM-OR11-026 TaxID=1314800 RepID=A0A1B7MUX7_9AGAM|nr:hypothetical protein K503DRAFT_311119 [Rhizopogon vinicolor AM-OR11-026]
MKFIALTTMIVSVAVMAGADEQIIGLPCAKTNYQECGHLAGHNDGKDFVFWCGAQNTITDYSDCNCSNCCIDPYPLAHAFCSETCTCIQ